MKEKLMSMLEVLAEKLGTTTELLWSVLVKQAGVEAQIWTMWFIAWVSIFGCIFLTSFVLAEICRRKEWSEWACWYVLTVFSAILGTVTSIACYTEILTLTQNPEYWALNEILSRL